MAHILIVDNEPRVRDLVRGILNDGGHAVSEAADGLLVAHIVAQNPPDLVIMDLSMPIKSGVDTILALRHEHPDLKILAISGGTMLEAARRMGANAVLPKPFRRAELHAAVAALLGN